MTQAYTAVAIMQLVEAEQDDPGRPGRQARGRPAGGMAGHHGAAALAHVSGLPDYTTQPSFNPAREYKPGEVIALVKRRPPGLQARHAGGQQRHRLFPARPRRRDGQRRELRSLRHDEPDRAPGAEEHAVRVGVCPASNRRRSRRTASSTRSSCSERAYIDPTEMATGYTEKDGKLVPVKRNSQSAWYAERRGAGLGGRHQPVGHRAGGRPARSARRRTGTSSTTRSNLNDGTVVPAHAAGVSPGIRDFMDIEGHVPGFSCLPDPLHRQGRAGLRDARAPTRKGWT